MEKHVGASITHSSPLGFFLERIGSIFDWLYGTIQEQHLDSVSQKQDETIFEPGRVGGFRTVNAILHKIQFAAGNRVCLKMEYSGKQRTIDPLSFREVRRTGNRLFYGFNREDNQVKAFSIDKIESIEVTNIPYEERQYPIEITASGKISMPPFKTGR